MTCTVVVCTRDRADVLVRCLSALQRVEYPDFTVLVVDSASRDPRIEMLARERGADYLRVDVPGLSRARNAGARACTSEIVAFIDDDAVPERDWLKNVTVEFEDPTVAIVTGPAKPLRVVTDSERIMAREAGFRAPSPRRIVDRATPRWFELANFGGVGNGFNMAFRRSLFDVWPGFDERLGRGAALVGGEESYAFSQVIQRGHRAVYTPAARVFHPYQHTMDNLRGQNARDLRAAASYVLFLLAEEPRHRAAVLWFIARGVARRIARLARRPPSSRVISRTRIIAALASGIRLYWSSRRAWTPQPVPTPGVTAPTRRAIPA